MNLLSAHDDPIFTVVTTVLRRQAPTFTSAKDAQRALTAILTDTHRAMSTFAEKWNAENGINIPVEVLAMSFECLEFDDRLLVSGVNRYWRAVALGNPRLWSSFKVLGAPEHHGKLVAMLQRSGNSPLTISLRLTHDEQVLLLPHVKRLKALTCEKRPGRRLRPFDAQQLEVLTLLSPTARPIGLSEGLLGQSPFVRAVCVQNFVLSPTCPIMGNLRDFSGIFEAASTFPALLECCPQLASLTVTCKLSRHDSPEDLFAPLPRSLKHLFIVGLRITARDPEYDALKPWADHQFRLLRLERVDFIAGFVQLFAQSPNGQWSMALSRHGLNVYVLSHDDGSGGEIRTEITGCHDQDAAHAKDFFIWNMDAATAFLEHLTAFSMPVSFLHTLLTAKLTFPALVSFTLETDSERDRRAYSTYPRSGRGYFLRVPHLQSFTFAARAGGVPLAEDALDWFFGIVPGYLHDWLKYDAAVLSRISLAGADPALHPWPEWYTQACDDSIYSRATEVVISPSSGFGSSCPRDRPGVQT
ncbi:hypothetical protein AURDEDRAFT_166167 [Auricularia subglabra TFB-10046 SS5]|nr:hypothetical protein AURDEDRAFT_166167 [Auricularia subglabra TFB-10046 SS5]